MSEFCKCVAVFVRPTIQIRICFSYYDDSSKGLELEEFAYNQVLNARTDL